MKPRVVVLYGGPDAERPVSIESGRGVTAALRELDRHEVIPMEIDRIDVAELRATAAQAIFPVLHGRWGEGGPLQELLEASGISYVGCRAKAAALAMDKLATKLLASGEGVPTPRSRELGVNDDCDIPPPLVLKPVDDGSSVDLYICRSADEVSHARTTLHSRRPRLMAEQYIAGREITAGVLGGAVMGRGDGEPTVLPLIEISAASGVYDYDAKYVRNDTRYLLDPELSKGVADAIRHFARVVFVRLGCRDLSRVDFIVDERGPWLLEVNTLPGFTSHSLLPMAAKHIGISMPELCGRLVDAALGRRGAATLPSASRTDRATPVS